jgi:glycosyltransferase involved in cell wall biosynthesis
MKSVAILIATYNWPEALNLVLQSVFKQTKLPNEILIADDGSKVETKILIEKFQLQTDIPIHHFWQEDKGFRKAKILNKAISASQSEYIIQVDGDCILHPKLVDDHCRSARKGIYLYGSRVNILPEAVDAVLKNEILEFNVFSTEIKNKTRTFHLPIIAQFYKPHPSISKKFRGCNVSFWSADIIAVNGYNEDFEGWGREDSDVVIRMGNNGVQAKRLRYAGIVFHLYHKINGKDHFEINNQMQRNTIANKTIRIANGVDQYL